MKKHGELNALKIFVEIGAMVSGALMVLCSAAITDKSPLSSIEIKEKDGELQAV